jgi:transposase-like protein
VTKSIFAAPHFNDEAAAYAYVEARLWANGRVCPHCGVIDRSGALTGKDDRIGLYKCYACRKPFTVKVGTIFESSHVQMRDWLTAIHLICSSKKGVSANQLHRTLGVTLKTAWFMGHRIREAMRDGSLAPMGGSGSIIEVDETAIGRTEGAPKSGRALAGRSGFRNTVLTLVERGGSARSFHVDGATIAALKPIILANIARETSLMTDEWGAYREIGAMFASHDTVTHTADEYVRREGDKLVTTNTVEGFYSIFKRGMKGIYQHCKERHLHRYLAEFDFRYNARVRLGVDDGVRAERALRGAICKRLTYREPLRG